MYQKIIKRNRLLLTQDYEEKIESIDNNGSVSIDQYNEEMFSLSVTQGEEFIRILVSREDAERFSQAVLIVSGEVKVV